MGFPNYMRDFRATTPLSQEHVVQNVRRIATVLGFVEDGRKSWDKNTSLVRSDRGCGVS